MLAVFVLFICSFNALIIISEMTDDSGNPIMFYMYEQDKCYVVNSIPQSEKIVKSDNGYQKNLYYSDSCEGEFTSTEVTDFTEGENSYIGSQFLDESDCKYSSSYQVLETYLSDKCHTYEGSYMKYEVHSNRDCNSCVNTENTYTYYTCKLDTYSSEESHSSEGFDQSSSYEEEESTFDQSSSNAGFDQSSSGENIDTSSSESSSIDDSSNSNTEINSNDNTESESNEDTNNVDGDSLKTIILVGISILVLII
ncbi:hypothetical protein QTN25_001032 [Entamoeba marina]